MTYERINWKDAPETDTPVSASNLNKMDKGILDASESINNLNNNLTSTNSKISNLFNYNSSSGKLVINLDAL